MIHRPPTPIQTEALIVTRTAPEADEYGTTQWVLVEWERGDPDAMDRYTWMDLTEAVESDSLKIATFGDEVQARDAVARMIQMWGFAATRGDIRMATIPVLIRSEHSITTLPELDNALKDIGLQGYGS